MKQRLKLLKALNNDTLTDEQKEYVKQFPHIYKKEKQVLKITKKRRK